MSEMQIFPYPTEQGMVLPLLPEIMPGTGYRHHRYAGTPKHLSIGTKLGFEIRQNAFTVVGRAYLPGASFPCALIRTETQPGPGQSWHAMLSSRSGYALACITMSDKGFAGERTDTSGPGMQDLVRNTLPLCFEQAYMLPDEPQALQNLVLELVQQGYEIILTNGGTGLSPRDLTPEALIPILHRRLHGFEQAMMAASLDVTPKAAISRAVAGTIGKSLVLAVPGSSRASKENLAAVLPALPHALKKLQGDLSDCGKMDNEDQLTFDLEH